MSILRRDRSKDIPPTYEIFDQTCDTPLKFGVLGLWNTRRSLSFYRLEAFLHESRFSINECNWKNTTQNVWCFAKGQDKLINLKQVNLRDNSAIVYKVIRFDLETQKEDPDYAFAVQPLVHTAHGETFLVQGQYQLPLFKGKPPASILEGHKQIVREIKDCLKKGSIQPLDHVQMIARLAHEDSSEPFSKQWFPLVQPQVNLMNGLIDPKKINNYVLHASHGKLELRSDRLDQTIEDFQEHLDRAASFFKK